MVAISIRIKLERSRSGKCSAKRDLGSTAAQVQRNRIFYAKFDIKRTRPIAHFRSDLHIAEGQLAIARNGSGVKIISGR